MKTIQFNTGRRYTSEGQVIRATLHDDGVVTFMDHSRGIHGQFERSYGDLMSLREEIMMIYDIGSHLATARSHQDGMTRGGCNTRQEG